MFFLISIWNDNNTEVKLMDLKAFRRISPTKLVSQKLAKTVSVRRVTSVEKYLQETDDFVLDGTISNGNVTIPITDKVILEADIVPSEKLLGKERLLNE